MKTKQFILVLLALFASVTAKAADNDVFTASSLEGVDMFFTIISEEDKTVQVGKYVVAANNYFPAIDDSYEGSITIPSKVTNNEKEYTVVRLGARAFHNCKKLTEVTLPNTINSESPYSAAFGNCESLTKVTIPEGVTVIGWQDYWGCTSLATISIPSTVTSIGSEAFYNTKWLNDHPDGLVYINNFLYTYKGEMPANTHIDVAEGTTTILGKAFYNCTNLTSITLPSTLTTIDNNLLTGFAFDGCTNLTSITFHTPTIGSWFKDMASITSVILDEEVENIANDAFDGCTNLASVTFQTPTVSSWFKDMTSITSVILGEEVENIANDAFNGCSSLTSVTVKNPTPVGISSNTFSNAANATLYVPQGPAFPAYQNADYWKDFGTISYAPGTVTFNLTAKDNTSALLEAIGEEYTGYYCDIKITGTINSYDMMIMRNKMKDLLRLNLADATIVANSYNYGTGVSEDNVFPDFLKTKSLKALVLPNTITSLGQYALSGTTLQLTSIVIPESVQSIGNYAFQNSNIESVTIPASVKSIGDYAFQHSNYNNIILNVILAENSQLETIGMYAFNKCRLHSVPTSESLSVIGEYAFANCILTNTDVQFTSYVKINKYAFQGCNLTSLTITSGNSIGEHAFENCSSLASIDVDVNSLAGSEIFYYCTNLKNVSIGAGALYGIRARTFAYCPIENLTVKRGQIGPYAFCKATEANSGGNPNANSYNVGINKNGIMYATLKTVELKEGVTIIGEGAFLQSEGSNTQLVSITLPESLQSIGVNAFRNSSKLTGDLIIPRNVTEVSANAFYGCQFTTIKLSPNTTKIGENAFGGNPITEIRLPSTLTTIEDGAFSCDNLTAVYAYMPDIITIGLNTFNYNSTLYVPSFLYNSYYWDSNWSQFTHVLTCELQPGDYEIFYSNSDVLFAEGAERITEDTPIATIGSQGSITVEGEAQAFDTVDQTVDESYSASLIGDGTTTADNNIPMNELRVNITVAAKKWYFFCFPFDVTIAECTYPGRYAWRYYDGATRAANGSGGWQVVSNATLNARQGYAFQSETAGTLTVRFTAPTFGGNRPCDLQVHTAANAQNASWNFVGNPYSSYYDFGTADITSPVTVWTGSSYTAYRPGDDELHLRPYQAFFIQKPEAANSIQFNAGRRESYRQSQQTAASRAAARKMDNVKSDRLFLNLTISDNDTAAIDRTRLVLNEKASHSYELECDAAKFLSDDAAAQIYMVEDGTPMAIDERPAMGDICVGYVAKSEGTLRLEAERMDVQMVLYDNETGKEFNLANGAYEFTTAAGTFNNRFTLRKSGEASAISSLTKQAGVAISTIDGGLSIADAEGKSVEVYTVGGSLVTRQAGNGTVGLTPGVYVVKVNGVSTKVRVD